MPSHKKQYRKGKSYTQKRRCNYINKYGKQCKNKEAVPGVYFCNLHLDKAYNLKVKKSAIKGAGYGLFAGKYGFKKGEIIGEYSRYDIRQKGDHCVDSREDQHICSSYLYCDEKWCWDARWTPSVVVRHANDSRSIRKNNAYFDEMGGRVFVMADKSIKPGKEIFLDYGDEYDWSFLKK